LNSAFVSGAAGFVGSHLVDRLLEEGFAVVGVDNLITGKVENLDLAKANSNFKFIELDVVDEIPDLGTKFDFIFHSASPASPPKYFEYPIETMMVNSIGTKNLLDLAEKNNARFIFFSTSEVYGDPLEHPQRESYWGNVNPIGPRSIYDEAKRFGEALVAQYVREKKVNAGIIRIFNTYGPRLDPHDGRVVSTFVRQAINGEALTINGDGNQTRSFCYISDLIDGIVMMAQSTEVGPINLGNSNEMTLNELIKEISKLLSKNLTAVNLPELKDDPVRRKPDISLAKEKLGWEPKVSLVQGLQLLISSKP
jgi:nucleoside-diphosphate-sugar epimerase